MKNIGAFKKSLIISIIYVGLSILALLAIYPGSSFNGAWCWFVLELTLPVSFLSFGLIYFGILDEVGILQVQGECF
nr:hypothetical protein [uncultured Bacteroides sp.]